MDKLLVYSLVSGMLFTGTINTLLNKYQDLVCVNDCETDHPKYFEQPLVQTLNMFIGEILCLIVFYVSKWIESKRTVEMPIMDGEIQPLFINDDGENLPLFQVQEELTGFKQLLFLIPTLLDLTGTTFMNIGLIYTSASIYQMLRGSVVLFTGVFSTLFLNISHPMYKWVALVLVTGGVGIVGSSSFIYGGEQGAPSSAMGILMVITAQAFTATQFVVEEKILSKYMVPPTKAVGLEGLFGLSLTVVALPILHFTLGSPGNAFDLNEVIRQIMIPQILLAGIGISLSIAFFNYCGISVTAHISATSRSTIDTCRTFFIWMVSLALGWESFKGIQVVGFIVLIYGSFLFNGVVSPPHFLKRNNNESEEDHIE